ncbi:MULTISPECIES: DUF2231 domain-containing protein [Fischerella]|jgi:uncharacterized membrane protein|uniref:DUF2231 domain-containing protein n=1 Tax=Fischerella thermalis CCMEE 5330 TaxID=2019670 RepID=A0A2N6M9M9_9CYAN|nr:MULTISPECIES: DUF2231 domain-containing protein [Fischerella]PLZ90310.1 DUF2231 domain-containing protein [Fischerella thermalis CCMEE 5196]PMB04689.1 DUF2231 domain-containing protein [Fischerella thermalis CCMEE 5328]PMB51949.1 DUF2231 domain-containing protein [Fischerella thermalis CCMEE 5201]BCX08844.1 MAG: hypothetical protein KatS3mg066_2703 [Fischerella sp.]MBF1991182.1 DUF2231 domain-containing protein [Fischerella thermalis M58_A2018_009]
MNAELIDQLGAKLGANGLPYTIPIHPNLVHLTLGLFIIGILFDIVGVFFPLHKFVYKYLALPVERANFFDVGWYNMLASAIITFFTVAAGFYEIMLAEAPVDVKSAWGMQAMETMLWHGVGGVLLLALIVGMTVWRGFQRFIWRKDEDRQVQLSYLAVGMAIMFVMYIHGTLGAQMAAEFGIHNTADQLLRVGQDLNAIIKG